MKIIQKRLSHNDALNLLEYSSDFYIPKLSSEVDLEVFAKKLSRHANFLLCELGESICGYTAYYVNPNAKQIYITLICVDPAFQQRGLGRLMLKYLVDNYTNKALSIALEVVKYNNIALNFYKHEGFVIIEDRGNRFLMQLSI